MQIELLNLDFSNDEQAVYVAENDAYGIDGIQVMLDCSVDKKNLLFRMCGKSTYSFFNRKTEIGSPGAADFSGRND